MKKRWSLQEDVDRGVIGLLSLQLGVKPLLSRILYLRGIKTWEQAKDFFRPELSQLHDPFLMNGMDVAIKRIESAIRQNEKILIYGDYDVDDHHHEDHDYHGDIDELMILGDDGDD